MELLFGNALDRRELVDAGIVDQNIEMPVLLDRGVDNALRGRSLGNVARDGDGFAAGFGDVCDDLIGPGFARGVIDDDRGFSWMTAPESGARFLALNDC